MEHIHGLKNELRIKDLIVNYIAHRKKKSGNHFALCAIHH